jgi:hypothetical protein
MPEPEDEAEKKKTTHPRGFASRRQPVIELGKAESSEDEDKFERENQEEDVYGTKTPIKIGRIQK